MIKKTEDNKENNLSLIQKIKLEKLKNNNIPTKIALKKVFSFNGDFDPLTSQILNKSKSSTDEERISIEVVYEPLIKDAHGNWMSEETIRKAKDNYEYHTSLGHTNSILFHMVETEGFTIEKSWIQEEMDAEYSDGGNFKQLIKAGTWLAKVKWDESLWELKKSGEIGGLSLQAGGIVNKKTGEILEVNFDPEFETEEANK